MAVVWNGAKLLNMMAQSETKAAKFYREVANHARKGMGAQFFENMANDEERHYNIYTALLNKYEGKEELDAEVSEEEAEYMELLMEKESASSPEDLIQDAEKIRRKDDIFAIAEKMERDTVMFVEEIIRMYPTLAPDQMEVILKEEKKHLQMVMKRIRDNALGGRGM